MQNKCGFGYTKYLGRISSFYIFINIVYRLPKKIKMYERIGIPKGASPLVVHKEGGFSREENCGRRTEERNTRDIIASPSAAILHGKIA